MEKISYTYFELASLSLFKKSSLEMGWADFFSFSHTASLSSKVTALAKGLLDLSRAALFVFADMVCQTYKKFGILIY